jgi:hypothetical protein
VSPLTAASLEAESSAADRIVIFRYENRGAIPGTIRLEERKTATPVLTVNVQSDPRAIRETVFDAVTEQSLAQTLLEILA